jgi:hypothetical protein
MGFASLLSVADRNRMRAITRRVHLNFLPDSVLTDRECDKFIDSLSEKLIEANLKSGRDSTMVD